ncbi:hypothetical protein [Prauserella muralis]|nr:hypothetical protein [Prauserella muralis]
MRHLVPLRTDAAFADLVCADRQWVRAEFDAIVAASFGRECPAALPPATGLGTAASPARRSRPGDPPAPATRGLPALAGPSRTHPARQRSPPVAGLGDHDARPTARHT